MFENRVPLGDLLQDILTGATEGTESSVPLVLPPERERKSNHVGVHYLASYEGLPKLDLPLRGRRFSLICAENAPVHINNSDRRMVAIRCGFTLSLGFQVEAHIRQSPNMILDRLMVLPQTYYWDSLGEITVTLVNMGTMLKKVQRGETIAEMILSENHFYPKLVSEEADKG